MREITRITTIQVTAIEVVEDDFDLERSREITRTCVVDDIRKHFVVDDVVVLNVQDFVRDIEPKE